MIIVINTSLIGLLFRSIVHLPLCASFNSSWTKRSPAKQSVTNVTSTENTTCDLKTIYSYIQELSPKKRNHFSLEDDEMGIRTKLEIAKKVILCEKWKHVHILIKDKYLTEFKHGLKLDDCIIRYMDNDHIEVKILDVLNKVQVQHIAKQKRLLNFIVIDYGHRLNKTMNNVKELDASQYSSILRHFSRWLLLPLNDEDVRPNGFDNIAIIRCDYTPNSSHSITSERKCYERYSIYTSEWKSTGPVFSMLADVKTFTNTTTCWELFPNVKYGLNGRELRLTITQWVPYAIKVTTGNLTTFTGVCPSIIQILSRTFNFTYYFKEPIDGQWGQVENGRWTGQIGDVHRKVADMSGSWLGKDLHRAKAADFAVTLRFSPYAIVYLRRLEDKPLLALVRQFKTEVYIYGLCVFLGIFVLFLLHDYSWQKRRRRKVSDLANGMQTMGKIVLVMTSITLRQGITKFPLHWSDRILMATLWIFTIIITAVYCGNLIAFRAVPNDAHRFRTLSDMLNHNDMIIGFSGKSMLENLLKQTEDDELVLLWQRVTEERATDPSVTSTSQAEHVKRVYADGNYAYISQLMVIPSITAHDCRILTLDQTFLSSPYSFAFPQNSPLAKLFNMKLLDLIERGILDKMMKESFPMKQCPDKTNTATAMFLVDYLSVFIAIGVGIAFATVVLVFEILFASDVSKYHS